MPDQWILLIVIGLVAGVLSGMFGIGGGVVIVPALTVFLSFSITQATSTSLAALLLPVAIFAVIAYYRAGLLDVRSASIMAVGLLVMSWVGADLALNLPAATLKRFYGVFLLYMSWRFIEPRKLYAEWRANHANNTSPEAAQPLPHEEKEVSWVLILIVGLVAGVFSGMFGIGGGAVIVPALVAFLNYDQKRAVGTSLGALMLPVGLPGVLRYAEAGVLDLPVAAVVAVGLLFGAILGARIALGLPSRTVKQMYGVFLVFVALRFIFTA